MTKTPFFLNLVQTSVRLLCGYGSQNCLGAIGLMLKLRDVKTCSSLFFENDWKKCEKSTLNIRFFLIQINWSSSNNFEENNDEPIFLLP